MAPPPLLPTTRLYACPACREHIKSDTSTCPHCGAELHREGRLARAASAVMVSLALSGCPDKGDDTMSGSDSSTGQSTTDASTGTGNTTDTTTGSTTEGNSASMTESPTSAEPEYGVPATDTLATTTSTSGEPDYGVPSTTDATDGTTAGTTTGDTDTVGEPEYGVPQTTGGPEPDYGVPGTT
ncbi:hypothetical protein SAMN02745121_01427 [Nannocystis exedens]|uniref:Zinc-ribbon domain-containing protein n=1 Tax=Nannocystis exedens TaxID=54 RepID=A0A1I1UZA2_9BACT|nr:hypothetical protein [Nannocystis exedens]PCC72218.1 hypothetical protein NAEX_05297 [Nannocystis exedens]SFD76106.1 hypothetical protein SAMN02745121_01427 [Nannocystis exedens]